MFSGSSEMKPLEYMEEVYQDKLSIYNRLESKIKFIQENCYALEKRIEEYPDLKEGALGNSNLICGIIFDLSKADVLPEGEDYSKEKLKSALQEAPQKIQAQLNQVQEECRSLKLQIHTVYQGRAHKLDLLRRGLMALAILTFTSAVVTLGKGSLTYRFAQVGGVVAAVTFGTGAKRAMKAARWYSKRTSQWE
ncbi:MAG: hypothetical protein JSR80_03485 [Verrucomicrobia bacterium]|nr:hypothetical protein [Verrucomicrobiota bacterium]